MDSGSVKIFSRPVINWMRAHWRPLTLLLLSAALAVLYLTGRPYILYNDSDPLTYFRKAWWLLGRDGGIDVPSRGPGYPIWLIVTGAATFDTWWVLMVSQVVMAIVAPVLVYGILAPISRNAGFVAGLLFMGFGISYTYMNWVMTEELFLFVELLALLLISRYFCGHARQQQEYPLDADSWHQHYHALIRWLATPYPIVLTLAYATMVKPAAGPFFWIFILVCLLFRIEPWKRYIGPAALYVAIIGGWGVYDYYYSPVRFPQLAGPMSEAQRYFADAYYGNGYGAVQDNGPTIRPEDGPASQRLYRAVAGQVAAARASNQWKTTDSVTVDRLYRRFASDDALVREIFTRPNPLYFGVLTQAAAIDGDGGNTLLYQIAREHGATGVRGLTKYLAKHPFIPLMGPPNPYVGFMFLMKYYRYEHYLITNQLGMRNWFSSLRGNPIREDNGSASKAFVDSIRLFVDTYPQYVGLAPEDLAYFGTGENLTKFIIEAPFDPKYTGGVIGWIYQWLSQMYGEQAAGRLMGDAAIETTLKERRTWGVLVGDFLEGMGFAARSNTTVVNLVADFRQAFHGARDAADALLVGTLEGGRTNQLPSRLANQVGHIGNRTSFAKDVNATLALQYELYQWARPITLVCMLMFALPPLVTGHGRMLVAFLTLAFFASAAAWAFTMMMPGGDPRHEDVFAFFPLLISAIGFASLPRFVELVRQSWATKCPV
jgi:hypothetical protein